MIRPHLVWRRWKGEASLLVRSYYEVSSHLLWAMPPFKLWHSVINGWLFKLEECLYPFDWRCSTQALISPRGSIIVTHIPPLRKGCVYYRFSHYMDAPEFILEIRPNMALRKGTNPWRTPLCGCAIITATDKQDFGVVVSALARIQQRFVGGFTLPPQLCADPESREWRMSVP